jgi:methyltransferase (TIGR00027 family)
MMQVRTRFIEDRLAEEVGKGIRQVVILGAGFDTKAYRLTELLKHARIFEVDQPATQQYKRRRIREAGIEVPPNLTYVPIDFRSDSLGGTLEAAGYDSSQATFFIWEGVTMYLPETAIGETLRWVGSQAKGSTIIFDFIYRATLDFLAAIPKLENLPEQAKQAIARVQKLEAGEPWIFGIPNGGEREFLEKFGLTVRELLPVGGEESRKRYLMRSDGSFYVPLPPGMERPPVGAAANVSYCLVEAAV